MAAFASESSMRVIQALECHSLVPRCIYTMWAPYSPMALSLTPLVSVLATFVLGKGRVLPGLEQGVATMLVGERAELFCRDDYAYGEDGVEDTIPPGASLKFDLKLLEWGLTSEDKLRRTTMTVADKLAEVRKMKLEVCG